MRGGKLSIAFTVRQSQDSPEWGKYGCRVGIQEGQCSGNVGHNISDARKRGESWMFWNYETK